MFKFLEELGASSALPRILQSLVNADSRKAGLEAMTALSEELRKTKDDREVTRAAPTTTRIRGAHLNVILVVEL